VRCCFRYGKPEHFARECRSKKKSAQANLAQEEESALMFVERENFEFNSNPRAGGKRLNPSGSNGVFAATAEAARVTGRSSHTMRPVHLVEEKVFAQFNDEVRKEGKRWVLDNRASNHMTGVREIFAKLNSNVHGTIKFGDGSMVEIEGIGTILFVCKNAEHRLLAGVYLIPKLTTNKISLGQLDEIGYEIGIRERVVKVHDENQRLLARVERSSNILYVL
jgi:hypothetical protein